MEDMNRELLEESDSYAERMFWDYNNGFDSDGDDSSSDLSSGYNSFGSNSDVSSYSSGESRDSCQETIGEGQGPEVMQFRSAGSVCDNLKLILSMPELCDVTFLVGPDMVPVHGVRAILGTRSRKFYELIIKHINMKNEEKSSKKSKKKSSGISRPISDKLTIPVRRYDVEVFRNLVQFVHCGGLSMTEETVAGLYCGACQFELWDLSKACLKFVEGRVKSDSDACARLLNSTRKYADHVSSKALFDMIYTEVDKRIQTYKETSV